jgi:membrane protease YdiL (CAAX protease family)
MPWTFLLLAAAVVAVWLPGVRVRGRAWPVWPLPFVAAVAAGLLSGVLQWPAVVPLVLLACVAWLARHPGSAAWVRGSCTVAAALLAVALALHLLPGFRSTVLVSGERLSPDAYPFSASLKFDKAAAGLLLLAFAPRITTVAGLGRIALLTGAWTVLTVTVVLGTAAAAGYMRPDFKFAAFAPAWLAANLLFTCVAEEVLFRGLLQQRLAHALPQAWPWQALAVGVAALLFGVAHAGGGMPLVLLATLAGLGYGLACATTQRIEPAIAVHFAVNAVHFVGFTYPALLQ